MNSVEDVKKKVIEVLRTVYDPEIPINVYDLGLVYKIDVSDDKIVVEVGVTTPFCPIAYMIPRAIEEALKKAFEKNGKKIEVMLNLEKQWKPDMMTEEGRRRFKELYGYDPVEASRR
ncbi:MAG: phenylacetic acid degradation protein [Thermoprotei archaeon]|nr:MAG: phenylacetic acid degradation protein [Thermoprotei archaeon]